MLEPRARRILLEQVRRLAGLVELDERESGTAAHEVNVVPAALEGLLEEPDGAVDVRGPALVVEHLEHVGVGLAAGRDSDRFGRVHARPARLRHLERASLTAHGVDAAAPVEEAVAVDDLVHVDRERTQLASLGVVLDQLEGEAEHSGVDPEALLRHLDERLERPVVDLVRRVRDRVSVDARQLGRPRQRAVVLPASPGSRPARNGRCEPR